MLPDVGVYGGEVGLVEHGEFEFLRGICFGAASADVEVEGALQDRRIRDRVDRVEGEEEERLFEGPEDAGGEEEEVA